MFTKTRQLPTSPLNVTTLPCKIQKRHFQQYIVFDIRTFVCAKEQVSESIAPESRQVCGAEFQLRMGKTATDW